MAGYQKGLLLYNGNAGKKTEIENKLAEALPVLSQAIVELQVVQTTSEEHLIETCKKYAEEVEIVIIMGGDGTVHQCINVIAELENRPLIGILPGGTSNDFSRTLNIPQNMQQAAEVITAGNYKQIDVGKTNDCYFLNFWGIGLIADTSANIDAGQKDRLGLLSYYITTLKTFNQAESFTYRIEANGEVKEGEAILVLILNGRFVGTRQIPIDEIQPDDGQFNVLIVKNSNFTLFRELMMINQPGLDESQRTELSYIEADRLKIETGETKTVDTDGELSGETPAEVVMLPNHLRMVYGAE